MVKTVATELGPGSRLADRYHLEEQIGYGGMGRVYRARDERLGREVAVKVLDERADGDFGRACLEEARATARLTHPGIAAVLDTGAEDGRSFIVMELVQGRTLRQVLDERLTIPALEAAELAAQVADALESAHRQGVVHCDVKPHNIILTTEARPKLVDFGIARAVTKTRTTAVEEIEGSALYLAPEQVRGERLDGKTDVYALGAVLYEMLTGRPPFQGHSLAAVVAQRLVADPPPPRSLNPSISPELEGVVLTALARDPSERFPTAGALGEALRGAMDQDLTTAEARTARIERPPAPARRPALLSASAPWPWWRLSGAVMLGAVAVGLLVALMLAVVLLGPVGGSDPSPREVAVPNLVGKRVGEAPELLERARLVAGPVRTRPVDRGQAGTVVDQQPPAGNTVAPGSEVQLVVGVPR